MVESARLLNVWVSKPRRFESCPSRIFYFHLKVLSESANNSSGPEHSGPLLFVNKVMQNEMPALEPMDWRRFLQLDAKAAAVLVGCALFLVGFLSVLPRWLHGREQADFAGVTAQTVPGKVTMLQISPVTSGGGSLFNGVDVAFAKHQAYYALPPESHWKPMFGQQVMVTFRVGRSSHSIHVDAVTPH